MIQADLFWISSTMDTFSKFNKPIEKKLKANMHCIGNPKKSIFIWEICFYYHFV